MAQWKKRFEALLGEIKSNNLLTVTRAKFGEPTPAADLRKAAERAGGALPAGMEDFYGEMSGLHIEWSLRDPAAFGAQPAPTGAINLLPLIREKGESVFGNWKDVIWFEEGDRFRNVVPFDFFVAEACAALHPIPGAGVVHYHYLGEELCSTGYSFGEYLELIFESRGYLYWQTALCKEMRNTPERNNVLRNLPKIFPIDGKPALGPKAKT